MNRGSGFVIASVLSLFVLLGMAWATGAEEELKKLETERAAAVVKGDNATLERLTSDDYTLINANGQLLDKKETMEVMKSGPIKITSYELSDLKVRVYGNTAVVTGKSTVKGTLSGSELHDLVRFTRI